VGSAGLDGTPVKLLCCEIRRPWPGRDMERSFYDGGCCLALARAGIGWATCWPCRDRVPEFGGTASFFVVAAWRSVCHFGSGLTHVSRVGNCAFGSHAVDFPGFACIRSAWRPAWFGLMRIFPPFPPHRAWIKFVVLRSYGPFHKKCPILYLNKSPTWHRKNMPRISLGRFAIDSSFRLAS